MKKWLQHFQQSHLDITLLRLSVILLFFIFANTKWFEFEVEALKPIISASWLSFLYDLFGVYKTSYLLGIIETLAYLGLIIGFRQPKAGLLGSGLVLITALVTVSLLPQLGFNGFIFKDILLIGIALVLFKYDLNRAYPL
ncbi:Uncharacterized membrane protein YkgB [Pasteurella multocida]|uniref:DUF417 family protein n=2 Tax=Pasteurella multocida TaxID=747 RepID=Q9CJR3_PASMU|nr:MULTISPECIES: DUF417 family protein [Pasteurella]EGP03220.1 hypothetical protein AAUPMG_11082 [Pasteurella multocida subsp. multocida str. Anand1_goat]EGP03716.1 hypothetical protein GEW_11557 [Pasteurella multocida subsp. gallicida str. Anand1_poultry]EJS86137.1 hypothetical protein AAUPMB_19341 [Pasteurella multocida subsp. multocida str. Anand1_buffalo]AAK04015.1 unknown [Pasteurella multocida subsp. multocida str. Pm70]AFF24670.1 hypothetical protein PMCN06_1440 [Pasteurella multocida s